MTSHLHSQTCRVFMNGMIERKRGHIVAIASASAKTTFPYAVAYCTTKFGIDGFMRALYDELCANKQDDFIKLSTVFPYFINTRQELSDMLDAIGDILPRLSPTDVANDVVNGILMDKQSILLPAWFIHFSRLME